MLDLRKGRTDHPPVVVNGVCVEIVHSLNIPQSLLDHKHHGHYIKRDLMVAFYHSAIESILAYGLTVWYWACSAAKLCRK